MIGMKGGVKFFLIFLAVGVFLYGRTLKYEFVYDDVWRIVRNPAIRTLSNPVRYFTDPATQSGTAALHKDSHRPLVTLSFALDYAVWKLNPVGWRAENILFHVFNATLVSVLGLLILDVSWAAALLAGLVFLVHPVQVESVVWIVERTNVMGLFFLLVALLCWIKERREGATIFFFLSLMTREIAVCFPAAVFLVDFVCRRHNRGALRWKWYAVYIAMAGMYLLFRSSVIGQVKIHPFHGGSLLLNAANVLQVWPLYLKLLIWPNPLKISYSDMDIAISFANPHVLWGLSLFVVYGAFLIFSLKEWPRLFLCLSLFLLFWLPGSNVIPLTTLFAERLMYPLLIFFGWAAALAFDKFPKRVAPLLFVIVIPFLALTSRQIPVWSNEEALWSHAVDVSPNSWMAWASLANVRTMKAVSPEDLAQAETEWINALKAHPPIEEAGTLFFMLAKVNRLQGKREDMKRHMERALVLSPELIKFIDEPDVH
jgi:hypothetical protein